MSRKRKRNSASAEHANRSAAVAAVVPPRSQMALTLAEDAGQSRLEVSVQREARAEADADVGTAAQMPAAIFDSPKGQALLAETARNDATAPMAASSAGSVGERLRRARELRGLNLVDLARDLKIGVGTLSDIETDRIESTTPGVYARSYVKAYARALDVPDVVVTPVLVQMSSEPELVAVQRSPRPMFGSQHANRLLYTVLTVLIGGPVLWGAWEASRRPIETPPQLAALDVRSADLPVVNSAGTASSSTNSSMAASSPRVESAAPAAAVGPVAASSVPAGTSDSAPAAPARSAEPTVAGDNNGENFPHAVTASLTPVAHGSNASRRISLHLAQASWVEIRGSDGQRIEYALLMAGTTRQYQISGHAEVRIGNARAAQVELDGQLVDLAPYTRSNVAQLTVDDSPAN